MFLLRASFAALVFFMSVPALAGSVQFTVNDKVVTALQSGTIFHITGKVSERSTWVNICPQDLQRDNGTFYFCHTVYADSAGRFDLSSDQAKCMAPNSIVESNCNFGEFPGQWDFDIWNFGDGSHVLASGSITTN